MHRITKGVIAVVAATALLIGGGGSLAYWQQTDTIADGSLSFGTGELSFEQTGSDVWRLDGVAQTSDDQSTLLLVPGRTLSFERQYEITADGDGLSAEITATLGALTATDADAPGPDPAAFDGGIVPTFTVTGDAIAPSPTDGVYRITGSGTITVVITLAWPFDAETDASTMDQLLRLEATTVTLTQVPTPIVSDPCACP
ncbi:alternate-type signal peptide domain-containing protein [Plantibacter flavus]|uniref:alternate-type signal peptide domain-containing protein n=1 Tax=Plantibacter flavus TaxID=150123 RepID=UPI003F16C0F8